MKFSQYFFLFILYSINSQVLSQNISFIEQDTLRGSNTSFRNWWDVKSYDIYVEPNFENQTLTGVNTITFDINERKIKDSILQIDLQEPMYIDKIETLSQLSLPFKKEGDFYFVRLPDFFKTNSQNNKISIYFQGKPKIAKNAPWDGGWIFTKDFNGNNWMTVACEGIGASVWLPCKDYLGDEPDKGVTVTIATDENLTGVGNGKLISRKEGADKNYYTWNVVNPINTYNIVPYIGDYINFIDHYNGEKGILELNYWVMPYNLEKAKNQFLQVKDMLKAFEYWFGPYPFYEDGYKLVESPYLGMEHQSAIAYGNQYKNGYLGGDRSGTGIGLKWDFIIIHESGHEWFGNSITNADVADMWIHEAFTTYSETLFVEYYYGKQLANQYIIGQRGNIQNDVPIIGEYSVHKQGSSDMYDKGANMIHTIRQIIGNDEKFRSILRGLNKDFYHQEVTSLQIENYISEKSGIDFSKIFDQYLRTIKIPQLDIYFQNNKIYYRWSHVVPGFTMKIKTSFGNIEPTEQWQFKNTDTIKKGFSIDENYYIQLNIINNN